MKKLFKNYKFNMFLIICLSLLVMYLTARDNFSAILSLIDAIDPIEFIFMACFIIMQQILIGYLIKLISVKVKKDYSLKEGSLNSLIASFFHGITPSASGGQFAQAYVHKKQGISISDSASILWLEFVVYQFVMVIIVAILLILYGPTFIKDYPKMIPFVIVGFIISLFVILGLWLITRFERLYRWVSTKGLNILFRLKVLKDKEKSHQILEEAIEGFNKNTMRFKGEKVLLTKLVLLNIVRNIMSFVFPFIVGYSLGLKLTSKDLLAFMALTASINMVNSFIPIPGASGGSEAMFVLFFSKLYGKTMATSMMIIWRFFSYYFLMILGGFAFILFQHKHGKIREGV